MTKKLNPQHAYEIPLHLQAEYIPADRRLYDPTIDQLDENGECEECHYRDDVEGLPMIPSHNHFETYRNDS
jgi:hypothetical protein